MHHKRCLTSALVCSFLVTSGCAGEPGSESESDLGQVASPILGGTVATQDQIHSTVALLKPNDTSYMCGGTLIAPSVVVTAAHCVVDQDPGTDQITKEYAPADMIVVAGSLDTTSATTDQRYAVSNIVRHAEFPGSFAVDMYGLGKYYDIAILLLQQPITTLPPAPVLPFAEFDSTLSQGVLVTIAGYGYRDAAGTLTGQLYLAQTPYQRHNDTEFIAGAQGSPNTCRGDSGGPVYFSVGGMMHVIGITSSAVTTAGVICEDGESIYTILASYESWLRDNSAGAYPPSGSAAGIPSCNCDVDRGASPSGSGIWIGVGISLLAARRRRGTR